MESSTILLVEDDPNDIFFTERAFKKAWPSCTFKTVHDGEEAVRYLEGVGVYGDRSAHPLPRFVLLDLKLPKKSGLEVLAWMKKEIGIRRIPVIVLTSSADSKDVSRAYDLGASSYLVKPADFGNLEQLARDVSNYWMKHHRPAR